MSAPLSTPALLFLHRRSGRELVERGVNLTESTREVLCDAHAAVLAAESLGLPKDFCFQLFVGMPVKSVEGIAAWASRERGFRRVDMLASWGARRGRVVPADAREAAYRSVLRRGGEVSA